MKLKCLVLLTAVALVGTAARAALYTGSSGTINLGIPNGDANGVQSTINVTGGSGFQITDMSITFTLSGGYNGDLYAVLSHGNSTAAVLLNRIGVGSGDPFGYSGAGGTFTFGSLATSSANIHFYGGGALSGPYAPDGRTIDPQSAPSAFDSTPSGNALTSFNSADPTGNWTLFFSDVVQGGPGASSLVSWSLSINAVPEPVNVALAVFGLCVVGVGIGRRIYLRARA